MKKIFFYISLIICLSPALYSQQTAKWERKVAGSASLGNPFAFNPKNDNIVYSSCQNATISVSYDRGENWSTFANVGGGNQISSILVSPADTNVILIGQHGNSSDFVKKSTNHGQSWDTTGLFTFSYFGVPLEWIPEHPNLVYCMNGHRFNCSTDFGSTWRVMGITTDTMFDQMCDMAIRPDSANIVYLGDNGHGIWKTIDSGKTWKQKYYSNLQGEVPLVAIDHNKPWIAYGTRYSGTHGIVKTTDYGETWNLIPGTQFASTNTWGIVTANTNNSYVYMGTYGGDQSVAGVWFSRNEGNTWERFSVDGLTSFSNDGLLALDTSNIFTLQGDGIYKYKFNITSTRNVHATFSVDMNQGIDFHNDAPLSALTGVYLKGQLPVLGANAGNWTYADTGNGTFVKMYDNGTHGDITANDKIYTRTLVIPVGTNRGDFQYKYGATYAGVDTSNNGINYLNNESPSNVFHTRTFSDVDTVLTFPVDDWQTKGISQNAMVTFSVDVTAAADAHNNHSIADATALWMKGSIIPLGRLQGNWTFDDTAAGNLIRLYNDGTHGDVTANDKIWATTIEFPAYTRIGGFQYRYGASYPGVESVNNGIQYLNNEVPDGGVGHLALLTDGLTIINYPTEDWKTKQTGSLMLSEDSASVVVPQNITENHSITISNTVETGGQNLQFHVSVEDAACDSTLSIGGFDTTSNIGREKGNVYHLSENSVLSEMKFYVSVNTVVPMYFFVYEGSSRTGAYSMKYQKFDSIPAGEGWKSSGAMRLYLTKGKYYYIGTCWSPTAQVRFGRNITNDSLALPFGAVLQGQSANNVATYPPHQSISGAGFTNPHGFYYQQLVTNTTAYISLSVNEGVIVPQQSTQVNCSIKGNMLTMGNHTAHLILETSDFDHPVKIIPLNVIVTTAEGVNEHSAAPNRFALMQNYPNPFNPATMIGYSLMEKSAVSLKVYNVLGQEVSVLLNNSQMEAGLHQVAFDASKLTSGIYFYRLTASASGKQIFTETRKLLLMK